jgi:hypothetical protein
MRKNLMRPAWALLPWALLLMGFFLPCLARADADIHRGMMLMDARSRMLADGWKPINLHASVSSDSASPNYVDAGTMVFYRAGLHEVDSCAGGQTVCLFHYRKRSECRTLVTYGESPHDSFVTHWLNTCGD